MPPPSSPTQSEPATPQAMGSGLGASILILVGSFGTLALFKLARPPVMPPEAALASRFKDSIRGRGLMDETGARIGPVPDAVHEVSLYRVTQNGLRLWSDPMAYIRLARRRSDAGAVFLLHEFPQDKPVGGIDRVDGDRRNGGVMGVSVHTSVQILFGRGTKDRAAGAIAASGAGGNPVHGAAPARAEWLAQDLCAKGCTPLAIPCGNEPTLPMLEASSMKANPVPLSTADLSEILSRAAA